MAFRQDPGLEEHTPVAGVPSGNSVSVRFIAALASAIDWGAAIGCGAASSRSTFIGVTRGISDSAWNTHLRSSTRLRSSRYLFCLNGDTALLHSQRGLIDLEAVL